MRSKTVKKVASPGSISARRKAKNEIKLAVGATQRDEARDEVENEKPRQRFGHKFSLHEKRVLMAAIDLGLSEYVAGQLLDMPSAARIVNQFDIEKAQRLSCFKSLPAKLSLEGKELERRET